MSESEYKPHVLCSDSLENTDKFPFDRIYTKRRNLIRFKKNRLFSKVYGPYTLLFLKPKLSSNQKEYFSNVLIKNKIKLVHAHFGPSGLEILPLARHLNIPVIVTFHGYDASKLLHYKIYQKRLQDIFKYSNIVTVSDYMKSELTKLGAINDKISVIRCGIPVETFNYIRRTPIRQKLLSNREIILLQVSNFVEKKGHIYTIKAFNNYLKTNKRAKLILAGDGYLRKKILGLCRELKIEDYVSFPGLVNETQVIELMNKADVFLHHSVTTNEGDKEGIPTVIMEAMATGLPVISTYHSGIPELVTNNESGFLVKEKDITAYTNSLQNLLNTSENIGLNAREKVMSTFNLSIESQKLFRLYDKLIRGVK